MDFYANAYLSYYHMFYVYMMNDINIERSIDI